jgi:hypothetical protein
VRRDNFPRNDVGNAHLAGSNQLITEVIIGKGSTASNIEDGKVDSPSNRIACMGRHAGLRR